MDRKAQLKYSLLEVFGFEDAESDSTRELMESYGIDRARVTSEEGFSSLTIETIREAIEVGMMSQAEQEVPVISSKAQRDDLALQRWREMAGLESKGHTR